MSDTPDEKADPAGTTDPLLAALHHLPSRAMEGDAEGRLRRQARAVYVRSFDSSSRSMWHSSAAALLGRAAVPVFLAGIVGLYMTWAIATATALVH